MPGDPNTVDPAQLADRLRAVVTRLNRRLRREVGGGLSPTATAALVTIQRHGPLSLRELAALEGVRPPAATATVASLETAGLVRREPDARDRRVVRIALTARGRQELERGRHRKTAFLAARLRALDEDSLAQLEKAISLLESMLAEGGA